jgi:hypothetical protein
MRPVANADRPLLDFHEAERLVRPVSGTVRPKRMTLFAVFRDEMFFCPAFFEHYRRLGVEQFLIIDDQSVDGTRDFLSAQPDCVLLACDYRFGQPVLYRDPAGAVSKERAGTYMKIAVPHVFLPDCYVFYADADEFLVLPEGVDRLQTVVDRLREAGCASAAASVVEMFPETVEDLRRPLRAGGFADLLAAYPYFDARPLVEVDGRSPVRLVNPSTSTRLFEAYGLAPRVPGIRGLFGARNPARRTPRHKTPLTLRASENYLTGSHDANTPPSGEVLLTLLHFVFTAQFEGKIDRARRWRSHSGLSEKYDLYEALLARMERRRGSFLDAHSERFRSAEQLLRCGLMKW